MFQAAVISKTSTPQSFTPLQKATSYW